MHKHTGFIIAITITAILLVIAAVLAYLTWSRGADLATRLSEMRTDNVELANQVDELTTELATKSAGVPFFYQSPLSGFTDEIRVVDSETGEDTLLYTNPSDVSGIKIYAVPKIGYNGHVFIQTLIDGDAPSPILSVLSVETGEAQALGLDLPVTPAISLSPDQTRIAAAYDNPDFDPAGYEKQIVLWDLRNSQPFVLDTIADDEFLAGDRGPNVFAGADGFGLNWTSPSCVDVNVYSDLGINEETGNSNMELKEVRSYCLE